MVNNQNASQVEFETPRISQDVVQFTTTLKVGSYVKKVASFEFNEMRRITRFQNNVEIPSADEICDYLIALLDARVRITRRESVGEKGKFLNQMRVPSRWYVLLAQVGEVLDASRRFKFTPQLDLSQMEEDFSVPAQVVTKGKGVSVDAVVKEVISLQEMLDISEKMEFLLEEGYTTVPGVPRDIEGSLAFMSKTTISNVIRGMDKDNPAYAFLAFILENEVAAESYDNLDLVFRINYSSYDTYSAAFKSYFVQSTDNVGGNAIEREPN